jgi:hypothetical protein
MKVIMRVSIIVEDYLTHLRRFFELIPAELVLLMALLGLLLGVLPTWAIDLRSLCDTHVIDPS